MLSPHLPSPSCNIDRHKRWQRLKLIFLVSFLGLWAGGAGALMVLGWLWPATGSGDTWAISYSKVRATRSELEENVRDDLKTKIVTIYGKGIRFENEVGFFSSKDRIGEAIVLSTDGWLSLYAPAVKIDSVREWKIVTVDGKIENVEKALKDPFAPIIYVKAAPTTSTVWRPVEFADTKIDDEVFILAKDSFSGYLSWKSVFIDRAFYIIPSSDGHSDALLTQRFETSHLLSPGRVVVTKQGEVVGVAEGNSILLPSVLVSKQLASLLTTQSLTYNSLGVEGWFSEEQSITLRNRTVPGFLVTKIVNKNAPFQKGDVIMEINGQIVNPEKMWYTIQSSKEVRLKIMRNEKKIELRVPVVPANS